MKSHKWFVILNIAFVILIVGTIFYITPRGPEGKIYDRRPLFSWTGYATKLIIDDNPDFSSPQVIDLKGRDYQFKENLDLGDYFWKLKGLYETKPKKFNLESEVAIKLYKTESLNLENDGNTRLNVTIEEHDSGVTGQIVLDLGEIAVVKENSDIKAKQDE